MHIIKLMLVFLVFNSCGVKKSLTSLQENTRNTENENQNNNRTLLEMN